MGNSKSINKANYEDIQYILDYKSDKFLLINTLGENEQQCIIPYTCTLDTETNIINELLKEGKTSSKIIIYGKNCNDDTIYKKYNQLLSFGFYNTFIYTGGLFEWLLLQDIYGNEEFPTTKKELDILKYKPNKVLNISLLEY
jgi:hypothetical protein